MPSFCSLPTTLDLDHLNMKNLNKNELRSSASNGNMASQTTHHTNAQKMKLKEKRWNFKMFAPSVLCWLDVFVKQGCNLDMNLEPHTFYRNLCQRTRPYWQLGGKCSSIMWTNYKRTQKMSLFSMWIHSLSKDDDLI